MEDLLELDIDKTTNPTIRDCKLYTPVTENEMTRSIRINLMNQS